MGTNFYLHKTNGDRHHICKFSWPGFVEVSWAMDPREFGWQAGEIVDEFGKNWHPEEFAAKLSRAVATRYDTIGKEFC